MRLIDADKLIDKLKEYTRTNNCEFNGACRSIIEIVKQQPTAYDVNKVVSELERKRDFHYKQMETVDFENDIFAQHIFEEEHNRGIGLNKAIEIVKAGGTDEQIKKKDFIKWS